MDSEFAYTGDAHRELVSSYADDEEPFPTGGCRNCPGQEYVREEVVLLRRLLFPRCWNGGELLGNESAVRARLDELGALFSAGIEPYTGEDPAATVETVLDRLPALRRTLKKDAEAAYKGDPAAESYLGIIRAYPGFQAITVQRVAHALYREGASEYARELTEYAKTLTGIDIHPGAEIGEYFFVDHGSGVVIGETATVGDWVRIYQNVTLGVLHFEEEEDEEHMLKKGYKRHPDIGDHVVIGAGSNVMGAISIGDHVSIGANAWISEDVPENMTVYISDHPTLEQKPNGGKD